jgi:hypothetical protein
MVYGLLDADRAGAQGIVMDMDMDMDMGSTITTRRDIFFFLIGFFDSLATLLVGMSLPAVHTNLLPILVIWRL